MSGLKLTVEELRLPTTACGLPGPTVLDLTDYQGTIGYGESSC